VFFPPLCSWLKQSDAATKASEATGQAAQLTAAAWTQGLNVGFGAINGFLNKGGPPQQGMNSGGVGGMGGMGGAPATAAAGGGSGSGGGGMAEAASNLFGGAGVETNTTAQEEVQQVTDQGLFTSAEGALAGARTKEIEAQVRWRWKYDAHLSLLTVDSLSLQKAAALAQQQRQEAAAAKAAAAAAKAAAAPAVDTGGDDEEMAF
jgi:hypothetical protein